MTPDQFISRLYRESAQVPLANFPSWALDLLQQVISFDGAIWGSGHITTQNFHTQTSVDVDKSIFTRLTATLAINPIFEQLILNPSNPVDMADVIDDENFYQSDIYKQCFQPLGIERILSSIHLDDRSGIFTVLSLYRYERNHVFTEHEKSIQQQLLFHILSANAHRQVLALNEQISTTSDELGVNKKSQYKHAICDSEGIYHTVESGFLDILDATSFNTSNQKLPFELSNENKEYKLNGLLISQAKLGDLYRISIRIENQLDQLTDREKQVVSGICQGNTFKQIAKQLTLSPSTVSNHLYRIYLKLGINSRSELVAIAKK